ncbi:fimbrial protein [Pseudomonas asplenii]|uniref:fimbrial protein n=1 Tax=Pseudomonas asplenii TaxID=53407 RepID=UPI0006B48DD6|nr:MULTISPECIES: fimbrial protein [Pseudomonas]KPA99482.1 P pilus assembly protein, pilin FimA [Pseudomonas fuscovaginae]
MKTYLLPLVLMVAATLENASAETLNPGNLQIEGLVEGGTCNLVPGEYDRPVVLPPAKVSDFSGSESTGHRDFEISALCDSDITSVTFTFAGTQVPTDGARFANTGDAQGVGLWLYSRLGGVQRTIRADGGDSARTLSPSGGQAVLPLGAAYWKTGSVREGTLVSQATVEITYN